jgi:hypothetical protein
MKRYWMEASNGSVVPHESKDGEWVRWEDVVKTQDEIYDAYVEILNSNEVPNEPE